MLFSTSLTAASSITPNYLLYVSTKGAIEQMTRVLAKDLGRRKITVNTISPGPTATDGFYEGKTEQIVKAIEGFHPQGRVAQPAEIANAVVLVASDESSWMNGVNFRVNGGMTVG
jgi:3-oxoacyl-[acyl-carrier protein] reductase